MIVSVLLLLLPTSTVCFSIGNELIRTRTISTKSTNSDVSTSSRWGATTLLSASRNWNNNHGLLDTSTSSPAAASVSSRDEQAVDEYLEFLDRRYRRLHEDRPSNEFAHLSSSVWKWLHQEDGTSTSMNHATSTTTDPATNTEDALYVLGVAGLASKKLLQKHHLHTSATKSNTVSDVAKGTVIDVGHTTMNTPAYSHASMTASVAVTAESIAQTMMRLLLNRKALIQYQSKQLKEILALVVLRGPTQMIRSLWKFCDGTRFVKRTILMTITLSFLIFRTVSFIIANETA